jgi:DNA-binding transcriptional ArsR family regulator
MAHALPPSAPAILRNSDLDTPAIQQARIDLAACFRMAARLGMHEGICNHFSAVVPGRDDLMLVIPYGWAFSEITASRLLITEALMRGELCVCEIRDLVGDDVSTVSKHLSILRSAGVLSSEKRGLNVFYRLACNCFAEFLQCVDQVCLPAPSAKKDNCC